MAQVVKKAFFLLIVSILLTTYGIATSMQEIIDLDKIDQQERKVRLQQISVPQEIHDLLFQKTKDLVDVFNDHSIPVMAGYGTALDLIRHQILIRHHHISGIKKHDVVVDLIINLCDKEKVLSCQSIFDAMGYRLIEDQSLSRLVLESKKPTIFSYRGKTFSHVNFVDMFIFKEEKGRYVLAQPEEKIPEFLKRGWFTKDEFENRQLLRFGPIYLSSPLNVESYLKRTYGDECLIKAYFSSVHLMPGETIRYQWTLSDEEKIPALPSKPLEDHYIDYKKQKYWDVFYQAKGISDPSSFALLSLTFMKSGESVAEIGCGNGRDAFFFARNHLVVKGVDASETAIQKNNEIVQTLYASGLRASFRKMNVIYSQEQLSDFIGRADHLYARFFLHELSPNDQKHFMSFLNAMHSGLKVYFEFRTDKDPLLKKSILSEYNEGYAYGHYRRFINLEKFLKKLKKSFQLIFVDERDGLSIVKKDDGYIDNPFLARIIAERK